MMQPRLKMQRRPSPFRVRDERDHARCENGSAGKLTSEVKVLVGTYQRGFEAASREAHELKRL